MLLGSENRPAFVQLDMQSEYTMITGSDCEACVVKTYDSKASDTHKKPVKKDTRASYRANKYVDEAEFLGYYVQDRVCFNGEPDDDFCTQFNYPYEFYVIKQLPQPYDNSLFSGVLGLSANESSDVKSVVEHLKETNQIDNMLVAFALDEF